MGWPDLSYTLECINLLFCFRGGIATTPMRQFEFCWDSFTPGVDVEDPGPSKERSAQQAAAVQRLKRDRERERQNNKNKIKESKYAIEINKMEYIYIYERKKKVERLTFTFLSGWACELCALSLSLFVSPALLDCFLIDKAVVSLGRCPPGDARQKELLLCSL